VKHSVLGDGWNVLHGDYVWTSTLGKTCEFIQKPPLAILAIDLVTMCIGGERLARSATCENRKLGVPEQRLYLISGDLADVPFHKSRLIVRFIGEAAGRI